MTNPPYATGPANAPDPQQSGPAAASFQYRPHDPYGAFTPGQPTGPVLPPAPKFAQRWGILPMDGRPKQVTWMLQLLWIYLAAAVLLMLLSLAFSAMLASFLGSGVGLVLNLVFGLLVAAVTLVLIWAIARESLGRFGFENPRVVFYIGLGFLGLVALCGFIGALRVPFALVQILAVLCVLGLVFTKPVGAWLRERPGNQSRKTPEQRPADDHGFPGYQPPPPQWRDAAPQPPAAPMSPPPATGAFNPPAPPVNRPPAPPSPPSRATHPGWPKPPQ
jgi:hypothetical protein